MMNPTLFLSLFGISLLNSTIKEFSGCTKVLKDCKGVTYHLYTSNTPNTSYMLDPKTDASFAEAPFISGRPLVILLHGYTGDVDFSPNSELRPAFFKKGMYNIISLDYSGLVRKGCYVTAAYNADVIGMCIAQTVIKLLDRRSEDVSVDSTYVIGFSLGAQVSGSVGKYYHLIRRRKLPRITGLDPALPLFDPFLTASPFRLDRSDAEFVQILHSNAAAKGIFDHAGHLDFYINGGNGQPGCDGDSSCEHVRSVEVFAESLNSEKGFWGVPCQIHLSLIEKGTIYCEVEDTNGAKVFLGNDPDTTKRGMYYVKTRNTPLYAL